MLNLAVWYPQLTKFPMDPIFQLFQKVPESKEVSYLQDHPTEWSRWHPSYIQHSVDLEFIASYESPRLVSYHWKAPLLFFLMHHIYHLQSAHQQQQRPKGCSWKPVMRRVSTVGTRRLMDLDGKHSHNGDDLGMVNMIVCRKIHSSWMKVATIS